MRKNQFRIMRMARISQTRPSDSGVRCLYPRYLRNPRLNLLGTVKRVLPTQSTYSSQIAHGASLRSAMFLIRT